MKVILAFLPFAALIACSKPIPDETVHAVGIVGGRTSISVGGEDSLHIPSFNFFIFTYHDSIFEAEVDKNGEAQCYYLAMKPKNKQLADSVFKLMLNEKNMVPVQQARGGCFPDVVYLDKRKKQTELKVMGYGIIREHYRVASRRIKLPAGKPAIFESIRFEMDGRYQRYYFSDSYIYKDLRVKHYVSFKDCG